MFVRRYFRVANISHTAESHFADLITKCVIRIYTENIKISNNQELIQSDPISCPQNQKGNN